MDTTYSKVKEESTVAKLTAYEMVRKVAEDKALSDQAKVARINMIMNYAERKKP
jgi:hypothetical protein